LQTKQELYRLGARRISVLSVLPVGCLPSARTLEGGISRKCAGADNHAAQLFNSKLSVIVDNFASKLPNSKLVFIDIYKPFLEVIQNAHKYGSLSLSLYIFFWILLCSLLERDLVDPVLYMSTQVLNKWRKGVAEQDW